MHTALCVWLISSLPPGRVFRSAKAARARVFRSPNLLRHRRVRLGELFLIGRNRTILRRKNHLRPREDAFVVIALKEGVAKNHLSRLRGGIRADGAFHPLVVTALSFVSPLNFYLIRMLLRQHSPKSVVDGD